MNYLVLLLFTASFFVAVTAVADLFLVVAVSDLADAETEDEVVSAATAAFPDSNPESYIFSCLAMRAKPGSIPRLSCMQRSIMCGGSLNSWGA